MKGETGAFGESCLLDRSGPFTRVEGCFLGKAGALGEGAVERGDHGSSGDDACRR